MFEPSEAWLQSSPAPPWGFPLWHSPELPGSPPESCTQKQCTTASLQHPVKERPLVSVLLRRHRVNTHLMTCSLACSTCLSPAASLQSLWCSWLFVCRNASWESSVAWRSVCPDSSCGTADFQLIRSKVSTSDCSCWSDGVFHVKYFYTSEQHCFLFFSSMFEFLWGFLMLVKLLSIKAVQKPATKSTASLFLKQHQS